jgi:hypothetical protein
MARPALRLLPDGRDAEHYTPRSVSEYTTDCPDLDDLLMAQITRMDEILFTACLLVLVATCFINL